MQSKILVAELNIHLATDLMEVTKEIKYGDCKNKATVLYKICVRC
jgi:hypothetical protein